MCKGLQFCKLLLFLSLIQILHFLPLCSYLRCGGGGGDLVTQSCLTVVTPWTVAHLAPLSMGFSMQEYWSGLPFPSPGDLPDLYLSFMHFQSSLNFQRVNWFHLLPWPPQVQGSRLLQVLQPSFFWISTQIFKYSLKYLLTPLVVFLCVFHEPPSKYL